MKIPSNPSGPNRVPQDGTLETRGASRRSPGAEIPFAARTAPGDAPAPAALSRLSVKADWQRAHLDKPETMHSMIQESIGQLVASSPVASRLSGQQLAALEHHLAGDPVMRDLLTQHLEKTLV